MSTVSYRPESFNSTSVGLCQVRLRVGWFKHLPDRRPRSGPPALRPGAGAGGRFHGLRSAVSSQPPSRQPAVARC
jgi:hypothetical protein